MADRCVCCGEIIPEGRMVCKRCEYPVGATNRDNLDHMSNEQMGDWIATMVLGLSGERRRASGAAWARWLGRTEERRKEDG